MRRIMKPTPHAPFRWALVLMVGCASVSPDPGRPVSPAAVESSSRTSTTTPTLSVSDLRSDFETLYTKLRTAHFDLFAHRSRPGYDAEFHRALAAIHRPLPRREAWMLFQRFVAFGRVAHANIDVPRAEYRAYVDQGGLIWPIDLRIDGDNVYAGETFAGVHMGDRITAIDARPMRDILRDFRSLISADNQRLANTLLEGRFGLYAWLINGPTARFTVDVDSEGAEKTRRTLPAVTAQARRARAHDGPPVFALDGFSRDFQWLEENVAYLRPGPFIELGQPEQMFDNQAFVRFVDDAFREVVARPQAALIVDLRGNPGGDHSFSDPMIAWFASKPFAFASAFRVRSSPEAAASNRARIEANPNLKGGLSQVLADRYATTPAGETFEIPLPSAEPRSTPRHEGPVYVVVDRYAYSNAVNVAAIVQDYGFGVVVGEKTADLATTYGAMENFKLPKTGFSVNFPKALIVRPNGDTKADGVTPDVPIRRPLFSSQDVVLEQVVALARARSAR